MIQDKNAEIKRDPSHKSGVLTRDQIVHYSLIQDIESFSEDKNDKRLQHSSFDITLGRERLFPHKDDFPKEELGDYFVIPPFTSVIISSEETLHLPNFISGRFDLKIKWALKGLILQVGTQIEPGYDGKLFGLLHNFSNRDVNIDLLDINERRIITVEFCFTSKDTSPDKKKNDNISSLKQFLKGYGDIRKGSIRNFIESANKMRNTNELLLKNIETNYSDFTKKLVEKYEHNTEMIEEEMKILRKSKKSNDNQLSDWHTKFVHEKQKHRNLLGIIGGLFISTTFVILTWYLSTSLNKFYLDADDFPIERLKYDNEDLNQKVIDLEKVISNLESKIDTMQIKNPSIHIKNIIPKNQETKKLDNTIQIINGTIQKND